MGEIRLYKTTEKTVIELKGSSISLEKSLQSFIESHLNELLGIRFLKSEHSTGKIHGGRIDTLGIDRKGNPVIIEYKRSINQMIVIQSLSYLTWLDDHQADFELLVLKKYGKGIADKIRWENPRLLCIAADFSKFDIQSLPRIRSQIELIRYKNYPPDNFLLEWVNETAPDSSHDSTFSNGDKKVYSYKTVEEYLTSCSSDVQNRYKSLRAYTEGIGNDVQVNVLKFYIAFKRTKNFMCVEFAPQTDEIRIFLKLDPKSVKLEKGFSKDVSNIGHYSPGNLELIIKSDEDLEKAKPFIHLSYGLM
jgi:predicted transport protein